MKPQTTLALAGVTHAALRGHLFPGDGLEAAAVLICTSSPPPRRRLIVREMIPVPHDKCVRASRSLTWPGRYIEQAIDAAEKEGLTIILLHSHPGDWLEFSHVDDQSDATVLPGLFEAVATRHGSAIMTPDGAMRARLYDRSLMPTPVDLVTFAGDDIAYWWNAKIKDGQLVPRPLAYTSAMTDELHSLSAAVIGASGTGSIVGEQATRLGFGNVTVVDFDHIEHKNLNRILNSTMADADAERLKVHVFAEATMRHRGSDVVIPVPASVSTRKAVLAIAQCDVIYCCVDSQEGRQFADLIAAAFALPLFDVGVSIPTHESDGAVEIIDVCGRIDYVQPGRSSLGDRRVYTQDGLRAEYLRQHDPESFAQELADGYLKGIPEEAPAVISLNMRAASSVMNEFLARVYQIRQEPNGLYARTRFSLSACEEDYFAEESFQSSENGLFGRGAAEPLLDLPMLQARAEAAE